VAQGIGRRLLSDAVEVDRHIERQPAGKWLVHRNHDCRTPERVHVQFKQRQGASQSARSTAIGASPSANFRASSVTRRMCSETELISAATSEATRGSIASSIIATPASSWQTPS